MYVDDLLIADNDLDAIAKLKSFLQTQFHIKDLGKLKFFLGLEFVRYRHEINVFQRKIVLDMLKEAGLSGAKLAKGNIQVFLN